tara:strand:+ start:243 stop:590 length:348 start_codon:yes stop_codon:yes gene_type:complete
MGSLFGGGGPSDEEIGLMMGSGVPGDLIKAQDAMLKQVNPEAWDLAQEVPSMRSTMLYQFGITDSDEGVLPVGQPQQPPQSSFERGLNTLQDPQGQNDARMKALQAQSRHMPRLR